MRFALRPRAGVTRVFSALVLDFERSQLEARNLQRRAEAEEMAKRMEGTRCVLVRQASDAGQLYGSVTARDIVEALEAAGVSVERRQIVLDRPIKTLGLHRVRLSLHPEVSVFIEVNVARSEQEAAQQAAGHTGEFFEREELAPEEEGEAAEPAPAAEEEAER